MDSANVVHGEVRDRVAPHTELAILGAMLLDANSVTTATLSLEPGDFSLESHRVIYRTMREMNTLGEPIDYLTLQHALVKRGQLQSVGGLGYLLHLTEGIPRNLNIASYVKIVKNSSALRQIATMAEVATIRATSPDEEATEVLRDMQERITEISADSSREVAKSFAEIAPTVVETMRARSVAASDEITMGFTTTLPDLDLITMGLQRKEMSVWGGYQSDGKTSIALQIVGANAKIGIGCAIFSHESTEESVFKRVTSQISGIPFKYFKDPRLVRNELLFDQIGTDWKAIERCSKIVADYPIWVISGRMSIAKIRAVTKMLKDLHNIGIIVIDFVQKVITAEKDMRMRITSASEEIRTLTMETDTHAIVLSQLNMPDKKIKTPPTLWSMRESQGPADDAHLVCGLYRPLNEEGKFLGLDKIHILKNREGEMNTDIDVVYDTKMMMYVPKKLPDYNQTYAYGEQG